LLLPVFLWYTPKDVLRFNKPEDSFVPFFSFRISIACDGEGADTRKKKKQVSLFFSRLFVPLHKRKE
jgi:hypothetical protein